jgi:hypothetical protein
LHFILGREENSKETLSKHLKKKSLHPIQDIKEEMLQKFSVTDVTSMDTLLKIVQPERRENNMPPLLTLIQIHLKKVKKGETRSTFSKRTLLQNSLEERCYKIGKIFLF